MIDPKPHVSYMDPGSHQMNARSWEILVLNILKLGILRTAGTIPQLEINLTVRNRTIILLYKQ